MNLPVIILIVLTYLLIIISFAVYMKKKGIEPSFWIFFFMAVLIGWAAYLWVFPIAADFRSILWLPLLFAALLIVFILASVAQIKTTGDEKEVFGFPHFKSKASREIAAWFLWLIFLTLAVIIVTGILR